MPIALNGGVSEYQRGSFCAHVMRLKTAKTTLPGGLPRIDVFDGLASLAANRPAQFLYMDLNDLPFYAAYSLNRPPGAKILAEALRQNWMASRA